MYMLKTNKPKTHCKKKKIMLAKATGEQQHWSTGAGGMQGIYVGVMQDWEKRWGGG